MALPLKLHSAVQWHVINALLFGAVDIKKLYTIDPSLTECNLGGFLHQFTDFCARHLSEIPPTINLKDGDKWWLNNSLCKTTGELISDITTREVFGMIRHRMERDAYIDLWKHHVEQFQAFYG